MADRKYGVLLFAKDNASKAVQGLAKSAGAASKAVKAMGKAGAMAFKAIGFGAIAVNQGVELLKKFRDGLIATAEMSMAYRRENDPLIEQFKEAKDLVGSLAARVGDVLVNAFGAAVNALAPLIKNARLWLVENQKLLATGLIEFLQKFAQLTVTGVAKSIMLVTKLTSGFEVAWQAVQAAVNTFFSALIEKGSAALSFLGDFARAVGADGIAGKLDGAANSARELSEIFTETADQNMSAAGDLIHEQEKLEAQINKVSTAINTGIGQVASTAVAGVIEGTQGLNRSLEHTTAAEEKLAAAAEERKAKQEEANNKAKEALKVIQDDARATANSFASAGDAMGGAFISAASSAESAQEAVAQGMKAMAASAIDSALTAMQTIVTARAAEAAAGAASSQAGIPIVGPALAAAAAGTMFALVKGLIALGFQGMAQGGLVQGGIPGRDSVPAMLMPGEFVLTKQQTESLRGGGSIGGGPQNVNVTFQSDQLPDRVKTKRWIRQVFNPAMKDLKAQGM
jgi:hypothetical protein